MSIFMNNRNDKATNATTIAHNIRGGFGTSSQRYVLYGSLMITPTTDDARLVGMSCRRGTFGSHGHRFLFDTSVSECAQDRKGWKDVRMTQTPALHSTPLTPGRPVQSTPPAPTHPPHDSMFCLVSMHSNVALNPGIGHLVNLGSSQGVSRRTRRDRPEAAIVFAVTAAKDTGNVSYRGLYG